MKNILKAITIIFVVVVVLLFLVYLTPTGLFSREILRIAGEYNTQHGDGVKYAESLSIDLSKMELHHLKVAEYCGDGDCAEGCTIGYFYMSDDYTEKEAMKELGLGERKGLYFFKPKYSGSADYIVVGSQNYANGKIVEYRITGVC